MKKILKIVFLILISLILNVCRTVHTLNVTNLTYPVLLGPVKNTEINETNPRILTKPEYSVWYVINPFWIGFAIPVFETLNADMQAEVEIEKMIRPDQGVVVDKIKVGSANWNFILVDKNKTYNYMYGRYFQK